jgi:hypothetical protein
VSDHKLNFIKGLLTIKVQYHPRKDLEASDEKKDGNILGNPQWEQPQTGEYAKMLFFQVKNKPKAYSLRYPQNHCTTLNGTIFGFTF